MPGWATENKRGVWDDDNSDEFMAESLKEAEEEVNKNKGEQTSLSQQIKQLEEESTPKTDEVATN